MNKIVNALICKFLGWNIQEQLSFISSLYHISFKEEAPAPLQVYSLDSRTTYACGFADRLRGMITTYAYAKATGLPFRIDHRLPFQLEEFLLPNQVDWRTNPNELSYNLLHANPIVMLDFTKGERLVKLSKKRQHHFYSNINAIALINNHYGTNFTYSQLYTELFRPSNLLKEAMAPYEKFIQEGYISISFRFLQLMGDLVDVCGKTLPENEQQKLTAKCIRFVEDMHAKNSNINHILVTTDSMKFLDAVNQLPYVFVIPGRIGQIAFKSDNEINLKMFLDFFMISKAKKAYMAYTGDMYKSHFAQSAAETTDIPFESIGF